MQPIRLQLQEATQETVENHIIRRLQKDGVQNPHALMAIVKADPKVASYEIILSLPVDRIAKDSLDLTYDIYRGLARNAQPKAPLPYAPPSHTAHI